MATTREIIRRRKDDDVVAYIIVHTADMQIICIHYLYMNINLYSLLTTINYSSRLKAFA
jgi:hypothetical protein